MFISWCGRMSIYCICKFSISRNITVNCMSIYCRSIPPISRQRGWKITDFWNSVIVIWRSICFWFVSNSTPRYTSSRTSRINFITFFCRKFCFVDYIIHFLSRSNLYSISLLDSSRSKFKSCRIISYNSQSFQCSLWKSVYTNCTTCNFTCVKWCNIFVSMCMTAICFTI